MAERSQADQLCTAAANGNLAEVEQALENGAHVNGRNAHGRSPLQVVRLGSPAVVSYLLEAGAHPNARDPVLALTVAHDAAREGFLDTLAVLMTHGADVNLVDERGNLPLHLAAQEGHTGAVALLCGRTARPGLRNSQGRTALDLARGAGKMDTATWIVEHNDYFQNVE